MSRGLELVELAIGYRPSRGRRPPRVVAKAICATAAPGELTTLLGPNGTGKSTLVWLLDAHSALCTGPPEHLVADGHINAAFDSENLTFDQETVGFPLRATPIGTARLTASSVAGARVLARLGWEVATTGPTDIEVRATGTDFDVHGGSRTRRVDGLAGWARTVRPGQLRRADPAQVTAALVALARFGPFFAVHLDQPDNTALPMAERISSAAGRLGTQDRRVAASILFQGMATRLWSPVLGCLATVGIVPDLPAPMHWQLRVDGGIEPCVPYPGGWIATEDVRDVAALVERIVIRNVLQRGNADNPLVVAVVLRLLEAPPLAGTAALSTSGKLDEFRRRSCCLYYQIPDGGRCGDCALNRTPDILHRTVTQPRRRAR